MRQQYGEKMAEQLFDGLSAEPCVSIRLNPKKWPLVKPLKTKDNTHQPTDANVTTPLTIREGLGVGPVPWCPDAYYLSERPPFVCDPLFHAGVYYVQEASSMYLADVVNRHLNIRANIPESGSDDTQHTELTNQHTELTNQHTDLTHQHTELTNPLPGGGVRGGVALDLCAAPGGKSTLLRSLLPDEWLLVSNEPIAKRTQILAENMIKWGHPNTIVTQNYPDEFGSFADTFGLIVTDVPCSGEGMFRKDEGAIRDWSLDNVELCWKRQRDILTSIWPCLKEGGLLVYSTCTFNHFEDEDNARWIADELGAELLEERHFFPGRDQGEGFYIAALRKKTSAATLDAPFDTTNVTNATNAANSANVSDAAYAAKELEKLKRKLHHGLRCFFDKIPAPTQKGKDLIPDHALAMSTEYERGTYPECEITYDEALAYLRHEVLRIDAPKGIVLVTYLGTPLGFVKNIGNRANNLYPQEWRIRTTHTTPFCLFSV